MKRVFYKLGTMAAIAAISLGITTPQAEAATFNLACGEFLCFNTASSFGFSDDGIGLTVTGLVSGVPGSPARQVNQSFLGLGILGGNLGSGQVDSGLFNIPETLRLTFDKTVKAVTAEFRLVSDILGEDSVKVIFDGVNTIFQGPITSTGGLLQGFPGAVNFTASTTGTVLDFTVTDRNDSFRLYSVEVEAPAAVPEPSAVLGLIAVSAIGIAVKKKAAIA